MIPCYVISITDDFPNRKSLESIGLNPIKFQGVNAMKDEHLKYSEKIHVFCKYFCPKGMVGCGLSHILLAEKLHKENVSIALVLEDDAYPKVSRLDLEEIIASVPDDWEIIKLHCDLYCKDGSYDNEMNSSTACYLINIKGMKKLSSFKVHHHIDGQINWSDMKVYKSKYNMFMTDESTSTLRDTENVHWASYFTKKPTSGEKNTNAIYQSKVFRLLNTEYTVGDMLDMGCIMFIFFILYKIVCLCISL
jgi:GR25 family glycosyltransferase involved in LPS biosynthesis